MPNWQKKETLYLLDYIKEMRTHPSTPFGGSLDRSDAIFMRKTGQTLNSADSFYRDISPAVSYVIYSIAWVASKLVVFGEGDLSSSEKSQVLLIAKLMLLLFDSILIIFCTTIYIRLTYSAFKRQIRYCYMAIILLCPIFFIREYMHLDFHNLGYHILFLIVFAHDSNEPLMVGALSAVLVNFHQSYWIAIPFIFGGMILSLYRQRASKEQVLQKKLLFITDVVQLAGIFALVFLVLVSPWLSESSDVLHSIEIIIGRPIQQLLVGDS